MTKASPDQPLIALIGPTNAGKSTLFNRLTGSWQAVTAQETSTTRDRNYGQIDWQGRLLALVDTGGWVEEPGELDELIAAQMETAVAEADLLLYVYDAPLGLTAKDRQFINRFRGKKTVWLVANKVDSFEREQKIDREDQLGLPFYQVSATSGRGSGDLLEALTKAFPYRKSDASKDHVIVIAGRPNVGKSTLLNALSGSQRAVVSPLAGTTRDVVTSRIELHGHPVVLADTAGVRRRGQIAAGAEKFSVKRGMTTLHQADAVIVVIDGTAGSTRGDLHLIYLAQQLGKPVLLVFNKSDLMTGRAMVFHHHIDKFPHVIVSALTGDGLAKVGDWIVDRLVKK